MIYKIHDWTELFINPSYKEDERLFLKAKMMLQAFLLTSLFSFSYLLISYLISFSYGVIFMWINVVGFLALPLLLRVRLPLDIVGNIYIFIGSLGVVGIIFYSGGLRSPVLPWLAASPTLALMLMGRNYAILWTLIELICIGLFGYLAMQNVDLPQNFNTDLEILFYVQVIVGLILLVLVINLVFQHSRDKAYKIVTNKNQELKGALKALQETRVALEKSHNEMLLMNHELTRQKEITENKNKAITSSLRYAKNMQNAIMPNPHVLQSLFSDSFILSKPLNIVSGDFFFATRENNLSYVAVVDCTGHGVPGAMMSVIGSNLLKEAIKLRRMTDPAGILHFLNKGINSALQQQESSVDDGMEVGLVVLNEAAGIASFSGARIPLFYVQQGKLHQIKGNNFTVGGMFSPNQKTFDVHSIPLEGPTKFYMLTDGLKDQFGGPAGKKFMQKRVVQTLTHVHKLSMPLQKSYIAEIMDNWMKDEEQVDDITVLGFEPNLPRS